MRNLSVKCAPGYPMPVSEGTGVFKAGFRHQSVVVMERKRFALPLTAARVQIQITDLPYPVSAPPSERRT